MPVKPLSFKGDKKPSKKRKRDGATSHGDDFSITTTTQFRNGRETDDNDSWTSPNTATDLTGPTMIVLPTEPPTCLATDPNGRIFASPLENMIEDDPRTAEPHDVRQVWVATKIPGASTGTGMGNKTGTAGTEAESIEIGFKGAHGGWFSCDAVGVLGATREARGTEEAFVLEKFTSTSNEEHDTSRSRHGSWLLRTAATKKSEGDGGRRYLCAIVGSGGKNGLKHDDNEDDGYERKSKQVSISLRGDGELNDLSSRLILRMQVRFLPQSATTSAGQQRAKEKISRHEMEKAVGRRLEDDEVKKLKRARRHGTYHEELLDMRTKTSHDKFA